MENITVTINPKIETYEQLRLKEGDTLCVYLENYTPELAEYIFETLKYPFPNNTILILPKDTEIKIA